MSSQFSRFFPNANNNPKLDTTPEETIRKETAAFEAAQAAYNAWAEKTTLAEAVSPVLSEILKREVPFGELGKFDTHPKGWDRLLIFPWGKESNTVTAEDPRAAITALIDGFGTLRYPVLRLDYHETAFNRGLVQVFNVASKRSGNRWHRLSWIDRRFRDNTPFGGRRWWIKHEELNKLLGAAMTNVRYQILFYNEEQRAYAADLLESRMKMTVAEALEAKAEIVTQNQMAWDATHQKTTKKVEWDGKAAVVVDGVNLAEITEPVVLLVTTPQNQKTPFPRPVRPGNKTDLSDVLAKIGQDGWTFSVSANGKK